MDDRTRTEPPNEGALLNTRRTSDKLTARLRQGAVWVVGARVSGIATTLLINILLARLLRPDEFGAFAILTSVVAFGSTLAMLGLNGAVVRFIPESLGHGDGVRARQTLRVVFRLALLSTTVVSLSLALAWETGARWFGLPLESGLPWLVAASLGLLALVQLCSESLRSFHELRFASLLSGGQTGGLLSNLVFLILLGAVGWGWFVKPSLQVTLAIHLISMVAVLPLGLAGLWRTVLRSRSEPRDMGRVSMNPLRLRTLLATCLPLLFIQCLSFASTQSDLWIAGAFCPHDQLALYSAARRLMLVIAIPLQMANFLVIASVAELNAQGRLTELERLLRRAATIAALPSILALMVLLFAGAPILGLLFGPFYRDAALLLALLSLGQFGLAWAGSSHCALMMTGHQNKALIVNCAAAAMLFVGGSVAAQRFGVTGLAAVSAAVVALESILLWLLAKKLIGVWAHMAFDPRAAGALLDWIKSVAKVVGRHEPQSDLRDTGPQHPEPSYAE